MTIEQDFETVENMMYDNRSGFQALSRIGEALQSERATVKVLREAVVLMWCECGPGSSGPAFDLSAGWHHPGEYRECIYRTLSTHSDTEEGTP